MLTGKGAKGATEQRRTDRTAGARIDTGTPEDPPDQESTATSPTDEELAKHAQKGDHRAFADLVDRHKRRTYGLALHMLRNPEDAADAAQEAFLRCYTSLATYDVNFSFGAWLYRITYNHCLDILRRRRRVPPMPTSPERNERAFQDAPDPGPSVEELAERSLAVEQLKTGLDRLADEQRHILALRYTLNLTYNEMARVLDVPESTVTMRLHHAKRALRTQLAGKGGSNGSP